MLPYNQEKYVNWKYSFLILTFKSNGSSSRIPWGHVQDLQEQANAVHDVAAQLLRCTSYILNVHVKFNGSSKIAGH